jgi:hypothetical protein
MGSRKHALAVETYLFFRVLLHFSGLVRNDSTMREMAMRTMANCDLVRPCGRETRGSGFNTDV